MVYQINLFSFSRLNNQEASAFHGNVLKLLSATDLSSIGLTQQQVTDYEAKALQLTDQVYTTTASEFTPVMHAADDARCLISKRILAKVQLVNMAEEGHELTKLADMVNSELLSKYSTRIVQLPMQEKTAVIRGFIYDLNNKLTEDNQELLGIAGDIMKLEKANNDFQKAYLSRTTERATAELAKTATLRQELTDIFLRLCIIVQYMANTSTDEAKSTIAVSFVNHLNVVLADALTRLHQRKKKQDDEEDDGDGGSGSGSGSGSGHGSGTGSGSGSGTGGNTSGSGTTGGNGTGGGSGSGSGSGDKDYNDHDGIAEW